MEVSYFLDTYALVELIKGNKNYLKYIDLNCYTSILNLYELYFRLLREFGKESAEKYFMLFLPLKIEIKDEYIPEASNFKLKFDKRNISYVDALGYTMAIENKSKFVTADKEFKDMDNVEFVT